MTHSGWTFYVREPWPNALPWRPENMWDTDAILQAHKEIRTIPFVLPSGELVDLMVIRADVYDAVFPCTTKTAPTTQ